MTTETTVKEDAFPTAVDAEKSESGDETSNEHKRVHFNAQQESESASSYETGDSAPKRAAAAASAEAGRGFGPNDMTTDSTSDNVSYATSRSSEGLYEVIEYDPGDPLSDCIREDFFAEMESPAIEENSPAAEALRANANVHVSSVGKAARAIHVQAVRKFVKRATGATRSGVVKGKPPRVPFKSQEDDHVSLTGDEGFETVVSETDAQPNHVQRELAEEDVEDKYTADLPDSVVEGTMEAGKKVLGQVDPHDMIKLLRWRRKRSKIKKSLKSYVKGKVIDGEHELYTLSIAVMIGVRTSISKTNTIINSGPKKRWVLPEDFRATEKYEFRPKGGSKTPPHQLAHTFKFKDYSPIAFAYLRRLYGVNEFDFLLSICGNANFIEFISNAKSGQFFFYSSDGKYMIKTMTNAESKFLRRILPQYFRHCAENPNTMMTRFFGMYRVKMYHLRRNVKFVIMNSVYYTDKHLQTFYDLKGSTLGRDAKPGQAVKKDNDLRRGMPEDALALRPNIRLRVRGQLESDCAFLRDMGIMDYSMLVGVHHKQAEKDSSTGSHGLKRMMPSSSRRLRAMTADAAKAGPFRPPLPLNKAVAAVTIDAPDLMPKVPETAALTKQSSERHAVQSERQVDPRLKVPEKAVLKKQSSERRAPQSESQAGYFFDDGLDDDDSSYLLGSDLRPDTQHPFLNEDTERKKMATIENLYWPFHRLYDIHGNRLMQPPDCLKCSKRPCTCDSDPILKGYNIPKFIAPVSERKDGGLEMETAGLRLPMQVKGSQGEVQLYDGKIFYMGIIDVLQEYNSRKAFETKYRALQGCGKVEASCVRPRDYGDRFLSFFDEYSQRKQEAEDGVELDISEFMEVSSRDQAESSTGLIEYASDVP